MGWQRHAFGLAAVGMAGWFVVAAYNEPEPKQQPPEQNVIQPDMASSPQAQVTPEENEVLDFPPKTFTVEELSANGNDVKCAVRYHALALVAADHVKLFGDAAFATVKSYKESAEFYQSQADRKLTAEDTSRRANSLLKAHYRKYPSGEGHAALTHSDELIERCEMIVHGMRALGSVNTIAPQSPASGPALR